MGMEKILVTDKVFGNQSRRCSCPITGDTLWFGKIRKFCF